MNEDVSKKREKEGKTSPPETSGTEIVIGGQDASGVLNDSEYISKYSNVGKSLKKLKLSEIIHFTKIQDYYLPTDADHPIVVKTSMGYHCVDGWNLIEKAMGKGKDSIIADIEEIGDHSDDELILRKAASRTKTPGGETTYMESCRNTRDALDMLRRTKDDLRYLGHGGPRGIEGLTGNREDDARYILSKRFGKSQSTINTYLNHIDRLTDAAIQTFIEEGAKKDFFGKVQSRKQSLLQKLDSKDLNPKELSEKISEEMMKQYEAYKKGKEDKERKLVFGQDIEAQGQDDGEAENYQGRKVKDFKKDIHSALATLSKYLKDKQTLDELQLCFGTELMRLQKILEMVKYAKDTLESKPSIV